MEIYGGYISGGICKLQTLQHNGQFLISELKVDLKSSSLEVDLKSSSLEVDLKSSSGCTSTSLISYSLVRLVRLVQTGRVALPLHIRVALRSDIRAGIGLSWIQGWKF